MSGEGEKEPGRGSHYEVHAASGGSAVDRTRPVFPNGRGRKTCVSRENREKRPGSPAL